MMSVRHLAGTLLLLLSASASALDFKTVGNTPAILYDAPSFKSARLFVAPQGMPVEVLLSYGDWVKVRDMNGDVAWTPARGLSPRRNVVVRQSGARVRGAPNETAPVLMTADKGVVLELVDPLADGWVRVRHQDGIDGYVHTGAVWGI